MCCTCSPLVEGRDTVQADEETDTDRQREALDAVLPAQSSESATPNPAEIRRRDRRIEGQREEEEEREQKVGGRKDLWETGIRYSSSVRLGLYSPSEKTIGEREIWWRGTEFQHCS